MRIVHPGYGLAALTVFGFVAMAGAEAQEQPAVPMPRLKPGSWRMVMTTDEKPMTMVICVGQSAAPATALTVPWRGLYRPDCEGLSVTPVPDGASMTASCPMPKGGLLTMRGVLTGDLESGFKYETDNVASGSPRARTNAEHKTTTTGVRLGPCAPGRAVGEGTISMPNGVILKVTPRP